MISAIHLRWVRSCDGIAVAPIPAHLLALATFLGHVDVNSTAVYLTMTATLLQEANRRFEAFAAPMIKEGLRP